MNRKTKFLFGIISLFTFKKLFAGNKKFAAINSNNERRNCDGYGCGNFGAPRGEEIHEGLDFKVTPDQKIIAPFTCEIKRYGYPYENDRRYRLIEITGVGSYSSYEAKIMYIKPVYNIGRLITKGSFLCLADDISKKYDSRMKPHVHFELYQNGSLINPSSFFNH